MDLKRCEQCEGLKATFIEEDYDAALMVVHNLKAENARYREALELCIARAGFTDAPEACRLVIDTAREALKGGEE